MKVDVKLSPQKIAEFSHFITEQIGLYFPQKKWPDLEKGLEAVAQAFQFKDIESCLNWLMSSTLTQKQIEILASVLTVGETYFFRDMNSFKVLEENILPPLIYKRYQEKNKYLRIWSAGCSSGEEAYSIAIVLHKLIPDIKNWNITLLSTDINTNLLKKLMIGVYSEWSFRGVSKDIKAKYFNKMANGCYQILPYIKNIIKPFYLNLAKDPYPSLLNNTNAMDIIFCRNVLMYFPQALIKKIANQFFDCLVVGGYLLVSASEVAPYYFPRFKTKFLNGVTLYSKEAMPFSLKENMQEIKKIKEKKPILMTKRVQKEQLNDYKKLSIEFANQGKLEEALLCNEKAIQENKIDASLYYLRALIYLELNQLEQVIVELNRVIYLDKNFVPAYITMGNILLKQHNTKQANKYFKQASLLLAEMDPNAMQEDMTVQRLRDVIQSMQVMEE